MVRQRRNGPQAAHGENGSPAAAAIPSPGAPAPRVEIGLSVRNGPIFTHSRVHNADLSHRAVDLNRSAATIDSPLLIREFCNWTD